MKQRRKGNRKFLAAILVIIVIIGVLAGCSGKGDRAAEELSAIEVWERVQQAMNPDDLKQGDMNKLQKLYHINAAEIEDFILYTASSNVKADELSIIKVKDVNQVENVKGKILQRIKAQMVKFKDYRPDEYFLIQKHVLKTKGPFIIFAVSKEVEKIELAFADAF
ncbi:hypothetical protein AM501_25675 [Aneurinibacillus migulanus]|uniref:DUF4358 domain-containing protein n=1 Tax=Aneurinibacillus migulanus TaxID=47500 RepID=UPI0006B59D46|nr:DUF4358 domain-containing protein [Aneurinibacillus migulanus]KPD05545.1 hypothetical protein AM501_25675 [Aneurinibacillus migulanus]